MGKDFAKKIAAGAVWLLIWLLCWLAVGKDVLLPSPAAVLLRLEQLICTLPFWQQVGLSLLRILTGFALALVLGAVFGALTARSALADTLLSPALRTVRAIPVASFIILLFVLMSKEYIPTVTSFLMVLPVVWSNVDQGVRSTDIQLLEMAQVFRLSHRKVLRHIWLPQVAPFFLAAARTGMGLAWKAGVAAEVLCLPKLAIGTQVSNAKTYLETPALFAWTLTVLFLSFVVEGVLGRLLGRLERGKGGNDRAGDL